MNPFLKIYFEKDYQTLVNEYTHADKSVYKHLFFEYFHSNDIEELIHDTTNIICSRKTYEFEGAEVYLIIASRHDTDDNRIISTKFSFGLPNDDIPEELKLRLRKDNGFREILKLLIHIDEIGLNGLTSYVQSGK